MKCPKCETENDASVDRCGKCKLPFFAKAGSEAAGVGKWRKLCHNIMFFFNKNILPGRVSRVHYHEARERYFTLKRRVEFKLGLLVPELDLNLNDIWNTSWNDKFIKIIKHSDDENREQLFVLSRCVQSLTRDQELLTRRQDHLNRLWRSMTHVQKLLVLHIYNDNELAFQLDVCREEAFRLRCEGEPVISSLIERIAELNDEKGEIEKNRHRLKRAVNAAFERFSSIRTQRIHDQYINVRTYVYALLIVLPISFLIIANYQTIIKGCEPAHTEVVSRDEPQTLPKPDQIEEPSEKKSVYSELLQKFRELIAHNVLAFVFFGGFAGGLFSVVMRTRNKTLLPGEDAYFIWYMLTKPIVGAFGALLIFILIEGEIIQSGLIKIIDVEPSAKVFGFSLIAGFSERIVFPDFR